MSFIFERVPDKDRDFFMSMGLKNCWGSDTLDLPSDKMWSADRERNAYLIAIGGGYHDMPYFYDLWWNGYTIRMEVVETGDGNYSTKVNIIWNIWRISIPKEIWDKKDEIIGLITEAFSVYSGWCEPKFLGSINVSIKFEPEMMEAQ